MEKIEKVFSLCMIDEFLTSDLKREKSVEKNHSFIFRRMEALENRVLHLLY